MIYKMAQTSIGVACLKGGNHVQPLTTLVLALALALPLSAAPDRPPRAAGAYLLPRCQGWTEERFGLLALNAKGDLLG